VSKLLLTGRLLPSAFVFVLNFLHKLQASQGTMTAARQMEQKHTNKVPYKQDGSGGDAARHSSTPTKA
jgi:hypothetical protein